MRISIEVTEAQHEQLCQAAQRLNVPAEQLVAAALRDLLIQPDDDSEQLAQSLLEKNRELYERLAR